METEDQQLEELKKWWKENGSSIITGVVLGLAILFGTRAWFGWQERTAQQASAVYTVMVNDLQAGNVQGATDNAGILIDMFYDHFLARHWPDYAAQPLEHFSRRVYGILADRQHTFPSHMQRSMAYMVNNDLLMSYLEVTGIEHALIGIEGRLKRPSGLGKAAGELHANYAELLHDFTEFFPELIAFTREAEPAVANAV